MLLDEFLSFKVFFIASALLVAVNAAIIFWFFSRHNQRLKQLETKLNRFENEVGVTSRSTLQMGQRLLALEKSQAVRAAEQTEERSQGLKPVPNYQEEFHSYNEANQLFQMGLSVDEVVERCGISRAEASLLEAVSRNQDASVY